MKWEMVENWEILLRTIWITSGYVSITPPIEEPWFWIGEISGVEDLAITGSSLQGITINLNSLYVCFLAALSSLNLTGIQTTPSSAGQQYALPSTLVVVGSPTGLMDAKWLTNLWWSEMKEIRHLDLQIFDIGPYYFSLGWYLGWPLLWQIPPLAFKGCQAQKRPEHGDFFCAQLISHTSKGGRAV